jgi:hypothetical protein
MYQAIEAQCRHGRIEPLEPVVFDENETLVILRLPRVDGGDSVASAPKVPMRGAMRGMLSSVDEFIAAKQADIDREERS